MQIINNNSITHSQILENIESFVRELPNYNDIKDNLNSSTLQVIYQLLSGISTFNLYKFNMMRLETYLQYAQNENSVYEIARQLGYTINRASAPQIELLYKGKESLMLKSGSVLGKVGNENVVYFGKPRIIESGDSVSECYLGFYQRMDKIITNTNTQIYLDLIAKEATYIDNKLLILNVDNNAVEISKDIESYIVLGSVVDFSLNDKSTRIYLKDGDYGYGLSDLNVGSSYTLEYIENNGYKETISIDDIKPNTNFFVKDILSKGTNAESADRVRKNAPFYYFTLRRGVTEKDMNALCKNHNLIKDACATNEVGIKGSWKLPLKTVSIAKGDVFSIALKGDNRYSYVAKQGDSTQTIAKALCDSINKAGWASAEFKENENTIILTNASDRIELSPIGSTNLFDSTLELIKQESAPCCTIDIFYIKHNQTRTGEIEVLNETERLEYATYIQSFKMVGQTIVLIPAQRILKQLKLKIALSDMYLKDDSQTPITQTIQQKVANLLKVEYEFILGKKFVYGEILAQIAQITITKDNQTITPINSILANQAIYDYECEASEYLVFDSIEIDFN